MRNFKDLSRALASIAGGLKGIKDIIDTIEPGGGGGSTSDYSTTPHIVGKWIDGVTDVYEFTITGTMPAGRADTLFLASDVLEDGYLFDKFIDGFVSVQQTSTDQISMMGQFGALVMEDSLCKLDNKSDTLMPNKPYIATIRCTIKAAS